MNAADLARVARGAALWRVWWALWLLCGLVLLCTGCGGSMSDEDEPTSERPAVNCSTNPKACA
jgi:fructose-1,6-bisphosphatase/inositol monophosphatase family enzyme